MIDISKILAPHQIKAINQMHNGCILCGGVGTGKSRTALGYFYKEMGGDIESEDFPKMKDPCDLYIITTAKKRDSLDWESELPYFLLYTSKEGNSYSNKVVVDSWNNLHKYRDVHYAFFIFDEQRVVGYGAWTKAFLAITKTNKWILLSATPGDNWMDYMPVFIANGFYKNKTQFENEHVIYSYRTGYKQIDRYTGLKRLIRLRERVLVDMEFFRHTKRHCVDIQVQYDSSAYNYVYRHRWNIFDDKPVETASELCILLRKIVNSDPSRIEAVKKLVGERNRVIIFYNYDYELDILLNSEYGGATISQWNGHKHQPIPDSDNWVYLVQYNAGCEGWNCIKTDTIIFYSQNYSYKMMEQAVGRIDRMNTPYTDLWYFYLKSQSKIDKAISLALQNKKNFNEGKFK